jgi:hypothetical protein
MRGLSRNSGGVMDESPESGVGHFKGTPSDEWPHQPRVFRDAAHKIVFLMASKSRMSVKRARVIADSFLALPAINELPRELTSSRANERDADANVGG